MSIALRLQKVITRITGKQKKKDSVLDPDRKINIVKIVKNVT